MKQKIGVYICHCGGNISDYVDVEQVRQIIETEKGVVISKTVQFACSDFGQKDIENDIKEHSLDAIVVASCSPKLHLYTFQGVADRAGLNKYNYVQVNIREQCSWAHSDKPADATVKAIGLVISGIRKVANSSSLETLNINVDKSVLVIGAGVSGLTAAINLAKNNYQVHLIEKDKSVGGNIADNDNIFPNNLKGSEVVDNLQIKVNELKNISLYTDTKLTKINGSIGNINAEINKSGEKINLNIGSILVATGYENYKPKDEQYSYSKSENIITLPEFKNIIKQSNGKLIVNNKEVKNVSFIYCVGSRETKGDNKYCSRVCCTSTIYTALELQKKFKNIKSFHFYRDIRTYGKQEIFFEQSSKQGDLYFKFEEKEQPIIEVNDNKLKVKIKDYLSDKKELEIETDIVVLVTGLVPCNDSNELSEILKIPIGQDKFYNEIHPKLKPVETVIRGIYISGCSQGPKNISESVQSSLAAVSKINTILSKGTIDLPPIVAQVDSKKCVYCGKCLEVCSYNAIAEVNFENKTIAQVNKAACVGCSICGAFCPNDAIEIAQFTDNEITAMIDGFTENVVLNEKTENQNTKSGKKVTINGYPKIWKNIAEIISESPKTIPEIANILNVETSEITYNIMTMNKFGLVIPEGVNDDEDYYLYKYAGV